ncbi:hypothetical protein [Azohydromonas aeria]|uniref:hypothetical protein n=1 Tax=Azohydromonas aeria TaxID=2590212 RepID=UPI0012F72571|nr:hypothetical protein [Azohydromonas aeria]
MLKIEITDPEHLSDLWMWMGHLEAHEWAKKKSDAAKVVGMALMTDLLEGRCSQVGERVRIKNIRLAVKNGFNIETHALHLENAGGRAYLVAHPYDGAEG